MFSAEYSHGKSYFHFEVAEELPNEGILKGKAGEIRFKHVEDGIAIYDSSLLNSGFVYPGSCDDIYVPSTINDIPVTELHQTVLLKSKNAFTIEHGNLQRLYIKIGRDSLGQQMKEANNGLGALLPYMLREYNSMNQEDDFLEVKFGFCGNSKEEIEYCSICCDDKLVLHIPSAKTIEVHTSKTQVRGNIPNCVEKISFSGKVYPFIESGWDGDETNNRCFEELKNLKVVEGLLSGNICWSFKNCSSLEKLHLSNGIERIPSYAFCNCISIRDLYIPDTVTDIGVYAFSGCENLMSIHLPENLKKISEGMFENCKSLKKVYLSDSIEIIEDNAFTGCVNLRKPWIPNNIKYIAENAFQIQNGKDIINMNYFKKE